ncbi:hypothetical protein F4802DRAFT_284326 [Xylaria palmicola]|nr:hypothetical protein F4802DRAFT_284326 [Xylaria palmicola]
MPRSEQSEHSFSPRAVGGRKFIAFFHPAYPYPAPPLLTLAAVDRDSNGCQGVRYNTARVACGIVACNRWDDSAYLAVKGPERDGSPLFTRVTRPVSGVLPAAGEPTYYFVVDSPEYCYPVVPSFDHWRFPHGALPVGWADLSAPAVADATTPNSHHGPASNADDRRSPVGTRHVGCDAKSESERDGENRDVACFGRPTMARVAPFSHRAWFESNQMERYCQRQSLDYASVTRLLNDIGRLFGAAPMLTVPYGVSASRFELHPYLLFNALSNRRRRVSKHDHGGPCIAGIHREFLFARFAFNILSDNNYRFLGGSHQYTVRLFDVEKAEQYTAELDSGAIEDRSCIFPPINNQDEDDSSSDGETGQDYLSDTSDYRPSVRPRFRSPAFYDHLRRPEERDNQYQNDFAYAETIKVGTRPQCATSIGGQSLSSTLTSSSLETPHNEPDTENIIDQSDKPDSTVDHYCSKRPLDCGESVETSPPLKRPRIAYEANPRYTPT